MTTTRTFAVLLAVTMTAAVVVGLVTAPQGAAGELLSNTWGVVTIVDLYLALGAGWAWIAWREGSAGRAAAWALALVVTGSVALWVYVALAAARASSVEQLLVGSRNAGD